MNQESSDPPNPPSGGHAQQHPPSNRSGIHMTGPHQALKVQVTRSSSSSAGDPHSCCTAFLSPSLKLWPSGVPYGQLTKKAKTEAWFTDRSVWYAGTTGKWTAAALQPLSGSSLKNRHCPWLFTAHFAWKNTVVRTIHTESQSVADVLAEWSGTWMYTMTGIWWQGVLGKRWIDVDRCIWKATN